MQLFLVAALIFLRTETDGSQQPMNFMADLTNDLGVCILQVQSTLQYGNIAFSPYGVASMSVLLFEGATGNTALEIMRVMKLPRNALLVRMGFRDINRHLKTYFKSDGFLKGLIMSRDNVCFHASYQRILRLYGFDEPDTALSYPCNNFVPYSPPPTSAATSTTDGNTVTLTSVNSTTTISASNATDEVVTELTQTSQTVTIKSSPTFTSLNAESGVSEKESFYFPINLASESVAASETKTTTFFPTSDMTQDISTLTSTNVMTAITTLVSETTESNGLPDLPTMQTAETSVNKITTNSFQLPNTTTLNPFTTEIVIPTISENAMINSSNTNNVTYQDFGLFADGLSDSTQFGQLMKKHFSIKTNFFFPNTVEKLFNNLTFETSTFKGINLSTDNHWNLKNFSVKFPPSRSDFTTNDFVTVLPDSSFGTSDFNDNSTFFNTLVSFIDSTTQKVKDIAGIDNPKKQSILTTPTTNFIKHNISVTTNKTINVKSTTHPTTIKFDEKNYINVSRANVRDRINSRVLPKKSISESNEHTNARVTIPSGSNDYYVSRNYPNYLNVMSLKKSQSISSKFDIRSVEGSRNRQQRSISSPKVLNSTDEIINNSMTQMPEVKDNLSDISIISKLENDLSSVSLRSKIRENLSLPEAITTYADIKDFNTDHRNIRSYGHDQLYYHMNWFATPDQNIIRVPVFTYSAILPFAYIEDLKSKVVEIPLDTNDYSLILILPTPQSGVDQLLSSLSRWPLRRIWECLRPTAVYASIPKFSIVSHVNLKPAMYALGMKDIFYRYRADLSIMSPDEKLYVRSLEQVVTIYVHKLPDSVYSIPEKLTERHFEASHPFLYFVLDRESGVNLVAGILSNPSKHII